MRRLHHKLHHSNTGFYHFIINLIIIHYSIKFRPKYSKVIHNKYYYSRKNKNEDFCETQVFIIYGILLQNSNENKWLDVGDEEKKIIC